MTAAFASAITERLIAGNKIFVYGTYTSSGGATGGDVETDLRVVDAFFLAGHGSAVGTAQDAVNETFPLVNTGGKVTIVTNADEVGQFLAIGHD